MTAGQPTATTLRGTAVSSPNITDPPEIKVYVSLSHLDMGKPMVHVDDSGKLHIHPVDSGGPYLTLTVDDWNTLRDHVDAVIGAQAVSA